MDSCTSARLREGAEEEQKWVRAEMPCVIIQRTFITSLNREEEGLAHLALRIVALKVDSQLYVIPKGAFLVITRLDNIAIIRIILTGLCRVPDPQIGRLWVAKNKTLFIYAKNILNSNKIA